MDFRKLCFAACFAAGLSASQAFAQAPPNDSCGTPTPITGSGVFNFDTTNATTGAEGQDCVGNDGTPGIVNDVWFCWTATCDGLAFIDTCGQVNRDTKIAYYVGCNCPLAPATSLCCSDDACGFQNLESGFSCECICGEQYMIQIGHKPGTGGGPGTFTINCQGSTKNCATVEPVPADCCGERPSYDFPEYATAFGSETIAVATQDRGCPTDYVVTIYDLSNQGSAPIGVPPTGQDWVTPVFPPLNAPCPPAAAHNTWTKGFLGTVFGVALDGSGNIYVAHSAVYGEPFLFPVTDALGVGGAGAIYKIDANTAVAAPWASVPNFSDPSINPASESFPGIGNIAFDCATGRLFATNFEDGMIYSIDGAGVTQSTFDHGVPDNGLPGFAPAPERVWGVQVNGPRVYYAVRVGGTNQVWSVGITPLGNFTGAAVQETFSGTGLSPSSAPIADITFTPAGCMIIAERTMQSATYSGAHASQVLEFCFNGGTGQWDPSGNNFDVGAIGSFDNATGGVDYDFFNNRVFVTSDAVQFGPQIIYGLQGLPSTGGNVNTSILVDLDHEVTQIDKYQIGSLEVSCPPACLKISNEHIVCEIAGVPPALTGCYTYTFDITNNSGVTAQYVLFPSANITPNIVTLNPALANGDTQTVQVTICNVNPGDLYCFEMILADSSVNECCHLEHCVEIPDCNCFQIKSLDVSCQPGSSGFKVLFSITNLTPDTIEHMFLFPPLPPDPDSGMTITPNYIDLPTLPPFGTTAPLSVVLNFPVAPAPGSQHSILVSLHNQNLLHCCSKELEFTIPDCAAGSCCCPGDVEPQPGGNGVVDIDDLFGIISAWGSNNPAYDIAPIGATNGIVDIDDLFVVIGAWGPCD